MTDPKLYYQPPADEVFNEVKEKVRAIFYEISDFQSYRDEKDRILDNLKNVSDNFMYMLTMLDEANQRKLFNSVSVNAKEEIIKRLESVGAVDTLKNLLGYLI